MTLTRLVLTCVIGTGLGVSNARAQEANEAQPVNDANQAEKPSAEDLARAVKEAAKDANDAQKPLAEGEIRILEAVIMKVNGRVQWSSTGKPPWSKAKIDQLLKPESVIRSGLRSSVTLRVGKNTTLHVGSSTRVRLPQIVQEGAVLRTVVGLERGRVDFKVDRVGLRNDFTVVTPSTTLAVRGTGGAIRHGGLQGTEAVGARTNMLRSIELNYFASKVAVDLSGRARSTETQKNPVTAALFQTIGPPPMITGLLNDPATPNAIGGPPPPPPFQPQGPINNQQQTEQGMNNAGGTTMMIPDPFANAVCQNLVAVLDGYKAALGEFGLLSQSDFANTANGLTIFCGAFLGGNANTPGTLKISADIGAYCNSVAGNAAEYDNCTQLFVNELLLHGVDTTPFDPPPYISPS